MDKLLEGSVYTKDILFTGKVDAVCHICPDSEEFDPISLSFKEFMKNQAVNLNWVSMILDVYFSEVPLWDHDGFNEYYSIKVEDGFLK